jgi:hypothetical protein
MSLAQVKVIFHLNQLIQDAANGQARVAGQVVINLEHLAVGVGRAGSNARTEGKSALGPGAIIHVVAIERPVDVGQSQRVTAKNVVARNPGRVKGFALSRLPGVDNQLHQLGQARSNIKCDEFAHVAPVEGWVGRRPGAKKIVKHGQTAWAAAILVSTDSIRLRFGVEGWPF